MTEEYGPNALFCRSRVNRCVSGMFDSTHGVVCYQDYDQSSEGFARSLTVADNTISFGDEYCFNDNQTDVVEVAMMDSTHFVVVYRNILGNSDCYVRVGLVSDGVITFGTPVAFTSFTIIDVACDALDSTHVVIAYQKDDGSLDGGAVVCAISGMTVTSVGSENIFTSATCRYTSIAALDSTHFVITYSDYENSSRGASIVGVTNGGTTISSYGSMVVYSATNAADQSVSALDSTHFVIAYRNLLYGRAIVGVTNGGTTISSYGAVNTFINTTAYGMSTTALDSTHFVVGYRDGNNTGNTNLGTVSGTTITSFGAEYEFSQNYPAYVDVNVISSTEWLITYKDEAGDDHGYGIIWGTTPDREFGTESCFNTVNTEYNAVAMLDSTHVVVAYKDTGGAGYGCAKIGLIDANGNTVTWGAELCFNSAVTAYISVAALDSTHFVVAYQDDGGTDAGCARIGLVSGTAISSYGAENIFDSNATYISVAALDRTHFVVGYRDVPNSNYGTGIVGVVSGTTISSYGAGNVFNSAVSTYISIAALDSTHFVVGYNDAGNSNYGTGIVGLVSGTTISSYGSENVFNSAITNIISIAALDSTHFVVGYSDAGNSNYGTGIVGLVSGTTISSYGSENVFSSTATYDTSISILDTTHFVVAYRGTSSYGITIGGTVSGTTISSYGSENVFNSAVSTYISVINLSSMDYIVVYKDNGGLDYGCARVWGPIFGWAGIIMGISSPAKVMGIDGASITSVIGIS